MLIHYIFHQVIYWLSNNLNFSSDCLEETTTSSGSLFQRLDSDSSSSRTEEDTSFLPSSRSKKVLLAASIHYPATFIWSSIYHHADKWSKSSAELHYYNDTNNPTSIARVSGDNNNFSSIFTVHYTLTKISTTELFLEQGTSNYIQCNARSRGYTCIYVAAYLLTLMLVRNMQNSLWAYLDISSISVVLYNQIVSLYIIS